jgi:hypothetical protein
MRSTKIARPLVCVQFTGFPGTSLVMDGSGKSLKLEEHPSFRPLKDEVMPVPMRFYYFLHVIFVGFACLYPRNILPKNNYS